MAVIFYLSFLILSYFRVIDNLQFHIFQKFNNDFVAKSFNKKQVLTKNNTLNNSLMF